MTMLKKEKETTDATSLFDRLVQLQSRIGIQNQLLALGDNFKDFFQYIDKPSRLIFELYTQWFVIIISILYAV